MVSDSGLVSLFYVWQSSFTNIMRVFLFSIVCLWLLFWSQINFLYVFRFIFGSQFYSIDFSVCFMAIKYCFNNYSFVAWFETFTLAIQQSESGPGSSLPKGRCTGSVQRTMASLYPGVPHRLQRALLDLQVPYTTSGRRLRSAASLSFLMESPAVTSCLHHRQTWST